LISPRENPTAWAALMNLRRSIGAVVAVAARRPARIGQEPDLLVVAERLRRQIRHLAKLADAHGFIVVVLGDLTFQSNGRCTVLPRR
jgi:hypothetical protein